MLLGLAMGTALSGMVALAGTAEQAEAALGGNALLAVCAIALLVAAIRTVRRTKGST